MEEARLFSVVCNNTTKSSDLKLVHRKFHTNIQKNCMCLMPQDTVTLHGCLSRLLTHVQLAVNQNSQISFSGAAPQPIIPTLYVQPELPLPRCTIWHLHLLNFIRLVITQLSNLSRSLCKASPSLTEPI